MRILLLGGTNDAKALATQLHNRGLEVVYSLAGLVRLPELPCQIVSGGFSQFGGLDAYVKAEGITAILDATHPYAANISQTAVEVAAKCEIPCWRYQRAPWQKTAQDHWLEFNDWPSLQMALSGKQSVMITTGQLSNEVLEGFKALSNLKQANFKQTNLKDNPNQRQWLRTAIAPKHDLPANMQWLQAIGPFDLESEEALLQTNGIDALVTKNSGGAATLAKIEAARHLRIPVYFLARPILPEVDREWSEIEACVQFVSQQQPS